MPLAGSDPALETLLLPLLDGPLAWPRDGGALFMRARDGWPLHQRAFPGLVCEQSFKPEADALLRSGVALAEAGGTARYPLVLLLPPRQREEARALYARAIAHAQPGGRVLACLRNDEGAKSGEADLARLAGPLGQLSKNKCRAFWTAPLEGAVDAALLEEWSVLDAPRPISAKTAAGGRFFSRPGVFAWDRIDAASALLAAHLPGDLRGVAADLGAGYGYLSSELLARCPGITSLDLYEAEQRALDLARMNLANEAKRVALDFHWHDVTTGLNGRFDVIVSNPPFHAQGRSDRPDIGRRFIAVAAEGLKPGGRLWMVANRHLPYEAELATRFAAIRTVAQEKGFKVIEATGPR
ncbi:MAG TPA: methyltransferase [Lysobacter sp.]|nr:methyltransferase [Lysobacter sp.]